MIEEGLLVSLTMNRMTASGVMAGCCAEKAAVSSEISSKAAQPRSIVCADCGSNDIW